MRDHYTALGRVASAAIANGDRIVNTYNESTNQRGTVGMQIQSRGVNIHIDASPTTAHLPTAVDRQFSYMDGFDSDQLPFIGDAEDVLIRDRELRDFDGRIKTLNWQSEDDSVTYFDGVRVVSPLYAYGDDFDVQDYREVVQDLIFRSAEAFDAVATEFDIEMDADEALEETDDELSSPSFQ